MRLPLIIVFCVLLLSSCIWDYNNRNYNRQKYFGYIPVYSNDASIKLVQNESPKSVVNAGKIYAYQNYLLQCEVGEGIHVIDNSQPVDAKRIAFIKVKGANEISIKGSFLYTNSYRDLVVIDISNINAVKEQKRIPNAFNVDGYLPTPPGKGYYECVDPSKGIVVNWKQDSISYNSCIQYQ